MTLEWLNRDIDHQVLTEIAFMLMEFQNDYEMTNTSKPQIHHEVSILLLLSDQ